MNKKLIPGKVHKILSSFQVPHLDKYSQSEQRAIINRLQEDILLKLKIEVPDFEWKPLHKISNTVRDEIDIHGSNTSSSKKTIILIELDKWRADQIAKKFVSRTSHTLRDNVHYFAVCYGGTTNMNQNERKKFFTYCEKISDALCTKQAIKTFGGIILKPNK